MADIKLKNTANTEFSISHNGTRGAKAVTSDQIVVAVETINDFPANAETGDTVIVKDNNRGGTFIYDATQSAVNNGGTVFNGWVRQYSGAVNVKWFGAVGDGATDDTVAIQNAIDNSNNIEAYDSSFLVNTVSIPSNTNVIFYNSSLTKINEESSPILTMTNVLNSSISGIIFNGTKRGYTSTVTLSGCEYITIENCIVNDNATLGFNVTSSKNITVSGNKFYEILGEEGSALAFGGYGIVIDAASSKIDILNNYITKRNAGIVTLVNSSLINIKDNIIDTTSEIGIDLLACDKGTISGNTLINTRLASIRLGLLITDYPTYFVKSIIVKDNKILKYVGLGGYGLSADVSGDTGELAVNTGFHTIINNKFTNANISLNTSNTTFSGNELIGSGLTSLGRTSNITISSNKILDYTGSGISFMRSVNSIAKFLYINNNILQNVGSSSKSAIELRYVKATVSNNAIYLTSDATYGMYLPNGNYNTVISNNRIFTATGATALSASNAYYSTGLSTIIGLSWENNYLDNININKYTEYSISLFAVSGAVEKTIPLSLMSSPTKLSVIPTTPGAISTFTFKDISATSITVTKTGSSTYAILNFEM